MCKTVHGCFSEPRPWPSLRPVLKRCLGWMVQVTVALKAKLPAELLPWCEVGCSLEQLFTFVLPSVRSGRHVSAAFSLEAVLHGLFLASLPRWHVALHLGAAPNEWHDSGGVLQHYSSWIDMVNFLCKCQFNLPSRSVVRHAGYAAK